MKLFRYKVTYTAQEFGPLEHAQLVVAEHEPLASAYLRDQYSLCADVEVDLLETEEIRVVITTM